VQEVWDTAGLPAGTYRIVAQVSYGGDATAPAVVTVSTRRWTFVPLVRRK
jgi:hypothetical protein